MKKWQQSLGGDIEDSCCAERSILSHWIMEKGQGEAPKDVQGEVT